MADYEERIRRMEVEGTLTPSQAESLKASLAPGPEATLGSRSWTTKFKQVAPWAIGSLFVAALAATVLFDGGSAEFQDVAQTLNQPGANGEMNRTVTSLFAIGFLLVFPLLLLMYFHNSLVAKEEKVSESWAQVESTFQRRADLIPALVQTVSRYLRHERETFVTLSKERGRPTDGLSEAVERLIEAQREAADILRDRQRPPIDDQTRLERLFAAQMAVGGRMSRLLASVEAYPELRSSDQFLELQAQIEGTENRINVARLRFNDAVGDYNAAMRMMPWNLVAAVGGFRPKAYYRARDESRDAPALSFD